MGGASATLTGGNFWHGAATGLMVSALNHAQKHGLNKVKFRKTISQRFAKDANGKYILDPNGKATHDAKGTASLLENVEGLKDAHKLGGEFPVEYREIEGRNSGKFVNNKFAVNHKYNVKNWEVASTLFHEFRHGWQYISNTYTKWRNDWGFEAAREYREYDAYRQEILMGNNNSSIYSKMIEYAKNFNIYSTKYKIKY
jgi:hypothetical protein